MVVVITQRKAIYPKADPREDGLVDWKDAAPEAEFIFRGGCTLLIEGQILGNPKGLGRLGAVGARDGAVPVDKMKYADGRPGGFVF